MKIYAVLIEDRHANPEIEVFENKVEAVDRAKGLASQYCSHIDDLKECNIEGWIYYVEYSCESDSVRVTEHELQ